MLLLEDAEMVKEMASKIQDKLTLGFELADDLKERVRALRNQFNLWTSLNGIFDLSFIERLSTSDDHSFPQLFIKRMQRILSCLEKNIGGAIPTLRLDAIEEIQSVVRSLHRLGGAMRTEFPCNNLVRRIKTAVNGLHGDITNLLMMSDVVEEIKQLRTGLKDDEVEKYATRISSSYQLVFATLILVYKPGRIFGFLEDGTDDRALPINEADLMERKRPQDWMPDDAAQFVHFQHLLIDGLYQINVLSLAENTTSEIPIKLTVRSRPSFHDLRELDSSTLPANSPFDRTLSDQTLYLGSVPQKPGHKYTDYGNITSLQSPSKYPLYYFLNQDLYSPPNNPVPRAARAARVSEAVDRFDAVFEETPPNRRKTRKKFVM